MPEKNTEINVSQEFDQHVIVYKNLSSEILVVDIAKLKNSIREHDDAVKKSGDWISVLALLVSLVLANCTATFSQFLGLSPEMWKAIFLLSMIVSIFWLVFVVVRLILTRKERSIDFLIDSIKESKKE